jgi:phage-related protein (TIGR01555 family)
MAKGKYKNKNRIHQKNTNEKGFDRIQDSNVPIDSQEFVSVPKKFVNSSIKQVSDNLVNVMTTAAHRHRDVTNPANNFYDTVVRLDYNQLENIYMSEWVARKAVDLPIDFMFKNGFDLVIDGEKESELEKECLKYYHKHNIEKRWKEAIKYKKLYGGGIIFPKDRFQNPFEPYDWESFNGRDIEWIVKDVTYMAITPYIDIVSDNYFDPHRIIMAGVTIHADNCIMFRGLQPPKRRIPTFRYFGMSIYQIIFNALISDSYVSKGIVNMIYRGNMKYYRLKNFEQTIKQGGGDLILERIGLMEDGASIMSAGLLDAEDSVEFVQQSFASLDKIDQRSLTRLAAATDIPSMVLLGRAPESTGLGNDTSGELENFYNYISNEQQAENPSGVKLFEIISFILSGQKKEIDFKFKKPDNINQKVQAETDKLVIENMQAQQNMGLPDDIIIDYAIKNGLISAEQAAGIDKLTNEMLQLAEQSQEYEAENDDKSKTNSTQKE